MFSHCLLGLVFPYEVGKPGHDNGGDARYASHSHYKRSRRARVCECAWDGVGAKRAAETCLVACLIRMRRRGTGSEYDGDVLRHGGACARLLAGQVAHAMHRYRAFSFHFGSVSSTRTPTRQTYWRHGADSTERRVCVEEGLAIGCWPENAHAFGCSSTGQHPLVNHSYVFGLSCDDAQRACVDRGSTDFGGPPLLRRHFAALLAGKPASARLRRGWR